MASPEQAEAAAARDLVAILRLAHSGELAAALAYRGHWRSLRDDEARGDERRQMLIGRVLGALCHVSGWLIPMYGAGKLESRNVREYESAARHACACRRTEWIDCLLTMAEVEWDHEAYFRGRVLSDRLGRRLPLWRAPPPKAEIRESFEREFAPRSSLRESSGHELCARCAPASTAGRVVQLPRSGAPSRANGP